jgi:GLPGLI family protein
MTTRHNIICLIAFVSLAVPMMAPYGPWKLNGAKGLVLKAADTEGNFVFEAVGLTQKEQPIIRYEWNRKK